MQNDFQSVAGCSSPTDGARQALRIGTLTLHYGYNEGAILQAYCLAAALRRAIAHANVEIIDQRYPAKCAAQGPPCDARKQALQDAIDRWLPLSSQRFLTDDRTQAFKYIRGRCDLLVVGSDVLWKLKYRRRLGGLWSIQKYPFFPAFPNVYWPDETVQVPRVAYAASIGSTDWREIPARHRRRMRQILANFSMLSVRDNRTLRFLEWVGPELARQAVVVPDPTFAFDVLRDVDRDAMRERLGGLGVDFSRLRCGVVAGQNEAAREATSLMRGRGYQIVGIGTRNEFSDVRLFDHGFHPIEWAALFGYMDVCICERMHACIYCLLNGTPFVALDINESTGDPDTKLKDLLSQFGIADCCYPVSKATGKEVAAACGRILAEQWDWDEIRRTLTALRDKAYAYLGRIRDLVVWPSK